MVRKWKRHPLKLTCNVRANLVIEICVWGLANLFNAGTLQADDSIKTYTKRSAGWTQIPPLAHLNSEEAKYSYQTYAAPFSRSDYLNDEGYTLNIDSKNNQFVLGSDSAGDLKIGVYSDTKEKIAFWKFAEAPHLVANYSDSFKLQFQPSDGIVSELTTVIATSTVLFNSLQLSNITANTKIIEIVFTFEKPDGLIFNEAAPEKGLLSFSHREPAENWSEVDLSAFGFKEDRFNFIKSNVTFDALIDGKPYDRSSGRRASKVSSLTLIFHFELMPGQVQELKLLRRVDQVDHTLNELDSELLKTLIDTDPVEQFAEAGRRFASVPHLPPDFDAFSLNFGFISL